MDFIQYFLVFLGAILYLKILSALKCFADFMMLSFKENLMHVLLMVDTCLEKKLCSDFNFLCLLERLII